MKSPDNVPLGDRETVKDLISKTFPGIAWVQQPPMLDLIKDMPDHPLHALLPTLPDATRASMARSKLLGDFDAGDFSVQLYGFEVQPIQSFSAEIRGNGNPIDHNDRMQTLDFSAESSAGWERFRKYRDSVRGTANSNEGPDHQTATPE
jgi:hypothetical protein